MDHKQSEDIFCDFIHVSQFVGFVCAFRQEEKQVGTIKFTFMTFPVSKHDALLLHKEEKASPPPSPLPSPPSSVMLILTLWVWFFYLCVMSAFSLYANAEGSITGNAKCIIHLFEEWCAAKDDSVGGEGGGVAWAQKPPQVKLTKHPMVHWFDECVHMCLWDSAWAGMC